VKRRRWIARCAIGAGALALMALGLDMADRAFPPPLPQGSEVSTVVTDRQGRLLRAFALPRGLWRLPVNADQVDGRFIRLLTAYEDKRFASHHGVDPLAMLRAFGQALTHGRIVSGGSTLTMQLARLIEEPQGRTFLAKLKQMARALQIERRLDKRQILDLYLMHAPYGGNVEGVRAAALTWFGKEPLKLTLAEAALLVALPQLPERRRPDRDAGAAQRSRARVLDRALEAGVIDAGDRMRAMAQPIPTARRQLPIHAAHLAQAAQLRAPLAKVQRLTIDRDKQAALEQVAAERARLLGTRHSVAMVLADAETGEVLAYVGSGGIFDREHAGEIDMASAVRSPGSALKPLIYGLAFDQGIVHPETVIEDRPVSIKGYRPGNFDMSYQGDVSVRTALQLSLNVPAIRLLDAIGPQLLASRLGRAGVAYVLPDGAAPGLPIGLGGLGLTLLDLAELYTIFPNRGRVAVLGTGLPQSPPAKGPGREILSPAAAWYVSDILAGVAPPEGAARQGFAYKTGTSFGFRDSWAVGFDGRYVLAVWAGRPDGTPSPGMTGRLSAAPVLFEAWTRAGLEAVALPVAPSTVLRGSAADLPEGLRRFESRDERLRVGAGSEASPAIVFPPDGARVDLGYASGGPASSLQMKMQGGRAPFRWLANGKPLPGAERRRSLSWQPDGQGFSTLTVIDARGRSARVSVFIE
jgi:penicillin-binding protein 1C